MKKHSFLVLTALFIIGLTLSNCGNPPKETEKTNETVHQEEQVEVNYLRLGAKISRITRRELGNNLAKAISTMGTLEAVRFCNTRAIPLTDSVALAHNAKVKRVSDKVRNPANQASEPELAVLNEWKRQEAAGDSVQGWVVEIDGKMVGYYPIKTNGMCLQCHGTPEKDILPDVFAEIKKRYPADQATGYGINQLRGMFVVEMDKK